MSKRLALLFLVIPLISAQLSVENSAPIFDPLEDKFIEQKTIQDFERVYKTKIEGLQAILSLIDPKSANKIHKHDCKHWLILLEHFLEH